MSGRIEYSTFFGDFTCLFKDNKSILRPLLLNRSGPAMRIYTKDGDLFQEKYYENGLVSRTSGPAFIEYSSTGKVSHELYLQNGIFHNLNGSAQVYHERYIEGIDLERYFINGEEIYYPDYNSRIEFIKFHGFFDIPLAAWSSEFLMMYSLTFA